MKKQYIIFLAIYLFIGIPVSNAQWETLTNIPEKLSFPAVAVLNGKIHVMGGGGATGASDSHYSYNPATNKWDTLAPVPYKAQQPAGATLQGKIHYFGGGFPNSGSPVNSHYSYNPATNTWRKETNLNSARAIHYAVELNDTLYSLAGQPNKKLFEAYDTVSKKWVAKAALLDDSYWYGVHISTHGKIFRFGGGGFTAPKSDVHVYDPKTNAWTGLPEVPEKIHSINGTALGDSIYIGGGYFNGGETDKVWIYNIKTQTYIAGPKLSQARDYHRMVTINRCIYSVGGNMDANENMALSLIRHCPGITTAIEKQTIVNPSIKIMAGKIEIELNQSSENASIQLSDISVRVLYNESIGKHSEIETSNLTNGIYFLTILSKEGRYSKKVFITN